MTEERCQRCQRAGHPLVVFDVELHLASTKGQKLNPPPGVDVFEAVDNLLREGSELQESFPSSTTQIEVCMPCAVRADHRIWVFSELAAMELSAIVQDGGNL